MSEHTFFRYLEELIRERFSKIGEAPLCNGRAETTFEIFGFTFILCYRCTFIILGLILTVIILPKIFTFRNLSRWLQLVIIVLLISPALIDGIRQYAFGSESNNILRITTGFVTGIGLGMLVEALFGKKTENLKHYKTDI
ncbi:MAG: DUF2085 domain-containing protein [Acholeplasmataceae bacterium]|jgi:uncharacterized membrane protein|nr:DUF2085 domain-containing protein [Acholeplasmataceae bacterium]